MKNRMISRGKPTGFVSLGPQACNGVLLGSEMPPRLSVSSSIDCEEIFALCICKESDLSYVNYRTHTGIYRRADQDKLHIGWTLSVTPRRKVDYDGSRRGELRIKRLERHFWSVTGSDVPVS
jgi:hypothetical protein